MRKFCDLKCGGAVPSLGLTPEEYLLRKEYERAGERIISNAPVSPQDIDFLKAYFDWGPGGNIHFNLREFAVVFGMGSGAEVLIRIEIIVQSLSAYLSLLQVGREKAMIF